MVGNFAALPGAELGLNTATGKPQKSKKEISAGSVAFLGGFCILRVDHKGENNGLENASRSYILECFGLRGDSYFVLLS